MFPKNVALVNLGVESLGISIVAREAFIAVRNIKTTIRCTLEGSEDAGTSSCILGSNIEECTEGLLVRLLIELVDIVGFSILTLGANNITSDVFIANVDLYSIGKRKLH